MPQTRMTFIPELRAVITKSLLRQGSQAQIDEAFRKWNAGEPPATPFEHGAFSVFEQAQAGVEGQG